MLNDFFNNCFDDAIKLKERFKITEKKEWDSLTVILELNVQIGHYTLLLCNNMYSAEYGRNIDNKGDELSDILLQLCALCVKLNVKKEELKYMEYNINNEREAMLDFFSILGQVSETILEDNKYRHYKERKGFDSHIDFLIEKISKMFSIILKICELNNLNIIEEFKIMCVDANKFLDLNKE